MAQPHPSTPTERAQAVAELLGQQGRYGAVSAMSRRLGVSRQTLYAWRARGQQAVLAAFQPPAPPAPVPPRLERQILTLLVEAHASYRGIQRVLLEISGARVGLDTISAVVTMAQERARRWLATHQPPTARALALDELYGNARRGAYLHVVDVAGGAVWAADGPLPVDHETWTLLLWEAQAQGLRWHRVVTDGAGAMQRACATVAPGVPRQRDLWHVLHRCSQVQGRLDRHWARLDAQTAAVARQAARVAAGRAPLGRHPQTDRAAHAAAVALARRTADALRVLTGELRRLLEVVVLDARGLLEQAQRQAELDALLALLGQLGDSAPAAVQHAVQQLHQHVAQALPELVTFVAPLDRVQQELRGVLPPDQQALLAWAWQRRARLAVTSEELVRWVPDAWRRAARLLLAAWEAAVRVSSAVERWHSILRPHLAVHRTLSSGLLALVAVWHNHRVFARGAHQGQNPLQLSGVADAATDWLTALGYPLAQEPPAPLSVLPTPTAPLAVAA